MKLVSVLCQADDSSGKGLNVDQVNGTDILTHACLGGFQNIFGLVLICSDLSHLCQLYSQPAGLSACDPSCTCVFDIDNDLMSKPGSE